MNTIKDIRLIYSSPAYPPYGLRLGVEYLISKQKDGLHITDGNYDKVMDLGFIKMCFLPKDKTWSAVEKLLE